MSCRRATCCLALFLGISSRGRGVDWDKCNRQFVAPEPGEHALALNGVKLPDTCIDSDGDEHQIFIIGDWGGLPGDPETGPVTADHRKSGWHKRAFVDGLDDVAQHKVRDRMRERAAIAHPQYILNVGDNFYWGGVEAGCGTTRWNMSNFSSQWEDIFENFYTGDGLDGIQWLGVLGNHDYGGYMYSNGWDQAIMYTWKKPEQGRSMRWVTPALYWRSTVHYKAFSVEYFFLDTNVFDTFGPFEHMGHNICSYVFNSDIDCSCEGGPSSTGDCFDWFRQLWEEQVEWLQLHLSNSTADWQIVVTHFPPTFGPEVFGSFSIDYGIDLFVTGHLHRQEVHGPDDEDNIFAPTAWVVSGGGGGITSDYLPELEGDSQYGFMHMTLASDRIEIVNIQHTGFEGDGLVVSRRPCVHCSVDDVVNNLQVYQEGLQRRGLVGAPPADTSSTITSLTSGATTATTTTSTITSDTTVVTTTTSTITSDTTVVTATTWWYQFDRQSGTTLTITSGTTITKTVTSGTTITKAEVTTPLAGQLEFRRASDAGENMSSSPSSPSVALHVAASVGAVAALVVVLTLWLRGGIYSCPEQVGRALPYMACRSLHDPKASRLMSLAEGVEDQTEDDRVWDPP